MAYVWPRAVLVLLCWAATYWLLTQISTYVPPAVVYFIAIAWLLAGVVVFSYLYHVRRRLGLLPHQAEDAEQQLA
ncbi:MAG TPA: hypothetical protein VH206_16880 [Xanthobacteraceae bacterium]|jgi:hypothetical protein|nr:hypothetical protein [Xanthobacteraceae bacterium]